MEHLFRIILALIVLLYFFVAVFGDCPPPPKVKDGDYKPKKATYKKNKFVKYSCSAGFRLIGNKKIKCRKNGQWPATPVCLEQLCPSPPPVTHALLAASVGPSPPGSTVTFYCVPGFKMVGPQTITCKNDLSWSETPCCVPNECGEPPIVADATFTPAPPYTPTDAVTYTCTNTATHTLEGPATITCQDDGCWTAGPTCVLIECGDPPTIADGAFTPGTPPYTPTDTITYSCTDSTTHAIEGPPTVTCEADGRWSSGPACVLIECDDPPTVADATFTPGTPPYTPTDTVTYSCSATHTLEGPPTITCEADGRWTAGPVCIITTCCPPPSIPLGTFSPYQDTYMPFETVTYECCNGITITQTSGITNRCGGGGTWTLTGASLPSCEPTVCPPPPSVIQGDVQSSDQKLTYAINEVVTYECYFGPKPGETDSNTCGSDGLWANMFPDICNEQ